ncbi:molybdopterin-synthase adenylyltransferase MoeB [Formosa sp. S-31]|uniref:molybdopterin-synthase adenylyltransferase MoeB n=1 Tax=Formosa sp. S-31 TaxID=2790949 RepID=UPI003EBE15E6
MLNKEEQIQYKRHLTLDAIGLTGQEKLKSAKVLVVGAGGLGCPVLQYLTAAGVGTIGIIDHDVVDQTNLQRQVLYTYNDIGKSKVSCAINRLKQLNPFIEFQGIEDRLSAKNALTLFKAYDIIVDGSDNFTTRYLVNDAAVLCNKPVVFGSIFKFEGQVSVFNYLNGPTYRCLFPERPTGGLNCEEAGVLGVLPGIIGVFQANEVIKIICETGEVLRGKLVVIDALSLNQNILQFQKTERAIIDKLEEQTAFCDVSSEIEEMSFETYTAEKAKLFVLDVRTDEERDYFHLESYHIPLDELETRYQEIKTSKPILVYCQSGARSKQAIQILKFLGVDNSMFNLTKGISHVPI